MASTDEFTTIDSTGSSLIFSSTDFSSRSMTPDSLNVGHQLERREPSIPPAEILTPRIYHIQDEDRGEMERQAHLNNQARMGAIRTPPPAPQQPPRPGRELILSPANLPRAAAFDDLADIRNREENLNLNPFRFVNTRPRQGYIVRASPEIEEDWRAGSGGSRRHRRYSILQICN